MLIFNRAVLIWKHVIAQIILWPITEGLNSQFCFQYLEPSYFSISALLTVSYKQFYSILFPLADIVSNVQHPLYWHFIALLEKRKLTLLVARITAHHTWRLKMAIFQILSHQWYIWSTNRTTPILLNIDTLTIIWCQIPISKKVNLGICESVIWRTLVKAIGFQITKASRFEWKLASCQKWHICAKGVAARDGNTTKLNWRKSWFKSPLKWKIKVLCCDDSVFLLVLSLLASTKVSFWIRKAKVWKVWMIPCSGNNSMSSD